MDISAEIYGTLWKTYMIEVLPTDRPPCIGVSVKAVSMQPTMRSKVELCSEPAQHGICTRASLKAEAGPH
eukprot:11279889-Prorocentrum_lima.AAC.1